MKILRSVLAVILGYAVFAVSAVLLFKLTGRDPHATQDLPFVILTTIYGMVFAALGGILTARVAGGKPTVHAAVLSVVIALGAASSLIASPGSHAKWSQLGALLLMAPSAFLAPRMLRRRNAG